jgi:hypothetical protein
MYKNVVLRTGHKSCEPHPGVKQTMASVQFHSTNKYFTRFYCIRQTDRLLILSKGRRQTDRRMDMVSTQRFSFPYPSDNA